MTIFKSDSWWNKPLPASGSLHTRSDGFISAIVHNNERPYLAVSTGAWAMPVIRPVGTDPAFTIKPKKTGPTVTVRVPVDAIPMIGGDHAMEIVDTTTNQDVSLFEFRWEYAANGAPIPTCTGLARYWLDSEGIDERAGGTVGNKGHRGVPGLACQAFKADLVAGTISHRLKVSLPAACLAEKHYWPMVDHENDRPGIIPEGTVMRIKSSVDLSKASIEPAARPIAASLQRYGAIVGDTGGVAAVKVERGVDISPWAMAGLGWSAFEFIKGGWR